MSNSELLKIVFKPYDSKITDLVKHKDKKASRLSFYKIQYRTDILVEISKHRKQPLYETVEENSYFSDEIYKMTDMLSKYHINIKTATRVIEEMIYNHNNEVKHYLNKRKI